MWEHRWAFPESIGDASKVRWNGRDFVWDSSDRNFSKAVMGSNPSMSGDSSENRMFDKEEIINELFVWE